MSIIGKFKTLRARANDGRGVVAGAMSSFVVRVASALTTLVAMPIALHTLGELRFGTFLLLFGVINWINLGSFGVHSALGRGIASHEITPERAPYMLGAALIYAVFTTVLTAIAVVIGFFLWRMTAGSQLPVSLSEVTVAASTMIVLMTLQVSLQAFEGIRIGHLKIYVLNLTRLAGSIFALSCLWLLPKIWPTMVVFVIALNGGLLLSAILNAILVSREVVPRFGRLQEDVRHLKRLASSGLAFFFIGIASLLQTNVPVLVLASIRGPVAGIDFGLFVRLVFVLITGLTMITAPMWPALLRAQADLDRRWINKTLRVAIVLVVGAGLLSGTAIALFGDHIVHIWTGRHLVEPPTFKYLFGAYFLQMAWSHFWATTLMGCGRERIVSKIFLLEGLVMTCAGTVLTVIYGPVGMIAGLVLGFAVCTNWALPFIANRELHWVAGVVRTIRNRKPTLP